MIEIILIFALLSFSAYAGEHPIPSDFQIDAALSDSLDQIITDLGLDPDFDVGDDGIEQISLAVIDLTGPEPRFGGVNWDNFIYPASVYKMYVAAEILHQISDGNRSLTDRYVVQSPNDVDRSRQIDSDPRPLLQAGDTVTVNYLLDLMITRSDNTAANCLIDLAQRPNIDSLMHTYNWYGSEVTRKFLKRKFEDPGYEKVRGTETCARHAADFLYRIATNQLVNPWVSMQMQSFLGRQLDNSKLASGLPPQAVFYHKTGWFSYWTNDVGIVDDGQVRYIIACFLPLKEELALPKYKDLSKKIYQLIRNKNFN